MFSLARFLPSGRSDASAKVGPKGDICGRSHISKSFDCHKGAGGDRTAPKSIQAVSDDLAKFKDGKLYPRHAPEFMRESIGEKPAGQKHYTPVEYLQHLEDGNPKGYPSVSSFPSQAGKPKTSDFYLDDESTKSIWQVSDSGAGGLTVNLSDISRQKALARAIALTGDRAIARKAVGEALRNSALELKASAIAMERDAPNWEGTAMAPLLLAQRKAKEAAMDRELQIYGRLSDSGRYRKDSLSRQSSSKNVLSRYHFDSVLPRLDARQAPKLKDPKKKVPGQPCGNGWISAGYKCDPEKTKAAGARLRNPENSAAKARFTERMRKARGFNMGPRDKQMSDRVAKRIADKLAEKKEAIAQSTQPAKSNAPEPKARHRTMAKSIPDVGGLTSRMIAFENMANSPRLNEKGRLNASQIVQAFKEEIASREIKPLKLAQGIVTTQSAIATKSPAKAKRGAELLRKGVGLPKTPQRQGETVKRGGSTLWRGRNGQHFSIDSSDLSDREDRKQVANSAGKIPGKKCKGGYISANYRCSTEASTVTNARGETGRKLTAEGKKAAEDLAARVRSQRGLKPIEPKSEAGLMASFLKEAESRRRSPLSTKTIDTGAKSRISGLIKKLEDMNKRDRESLPENLRDKKPIIPPSKSKSFAEMNRLVKRLGLISRG